MKQVTITLLEAMFSAIKGGPGAVDAAFPALTNPTVEELKMAKRSVCGVDGCDKLGPFRHTFCGNHARRFIRYGDPQAGKLFKGEKQAWLLSHVNFQFDECLIWPFKADGRGSLFWNGRKEYAPRIMCMVAHGEPPFQGAHSAHRCGDLRCCNPRHLRWTTKAENEQDKVGHGTSNRGGARSGTAKLSPDEVLIIRKETPMSCDELAGKFGVSRHTIMDIQRRRSWAWL